MQSLEIENILNENKNSLLSYGVDKIRLFGSYFKGSMNENSDIDFIVEFQKGKKNYKNFIHLNFYLEDLFKKKIDLLTPESLSKYFGDKIISESKYVFNA